MAWGTKALHNFQNNDRLIILFRRLKFADTWLWHMNVDIRARTRHYLWTNWQSINVQIKPTCRNDFCSSLNFFDDALISENKSGHFVLLKWNIYVCSDSHPLALTRAAFEISITSSWRYSFQIFRINPDNHHPQSWQCPAVWQYSSLCSWPPPDQYCSDNECLYNDCPCLTCTRAQIMKNKERPKIM